jgi:hypothetical protein
MLLAVRRRFGARGTAALVVLTAFALTRALAIAATPRRGGHHVGAVLYGQGLAHN